MTFEEWKGIWTSHGWERAMYADWKAEREKLIGVLKSARIMIITANVSDKKSIYNILRAALNDINAVLAEAKEK